VGFGAACVPNLVDRRLGLWADLGALLLIAFLLPVAFFMHAFWRETDEQTKSDQMAHFMKNMAMAGEALVLFYAYNQLQGEAGLSITDPLFGRG
jgi:putative oxidoreductase